MSVYGSGSRKRRNGLLALVAAPEERAVVVRRGRRRRREARRGRVITARSASTSRAPRARHLRSTHQKFTLSFCIRTAVVAVFSSRTASRPSPLQGETRPRIPKFTRSRECSRTAQARYPSGEYGGVGSDDRSHARGHAGPPQRAPRRPRALGKRRRRRTLPRDDVRCFRSSLPRASPPSSSRRSSGRTHSLTTSSSKSDPGSPSGTARLRPDALPRPAGVRTAVCRGRRDARQRPRARRGEDQAGADPRPARRVELLARPRARPRRRRRPRPDGRGATRPRRCARRPVHGRLRPRGDACADRARAVTASLRQGSLRCLGRRLRLAPIGLLAAIVATDASWGSCSCCRSLRCSTFARERRARVDRVLELSSAYRGTALLLGDVVEADDATRAAQPRRRLDGRRGCRGARARRGGAARHRVRCAAARRRQDPDAERDHQQAWPAHTRGAGGRRDAHHARRCSTRSVACSAGPATSCAPVTSAGTAPATRTGSPGSGSRSSRGSYVLRRVQRDDDDARTVPAAGRRGARGAAPLRRYDFDPLVVQALARVV